MYSIYQDNKNRKYFVKRKTTTTFAVYRENGNSLKMMKYLGIHDSMINAQHSLDDYADRISLKWFGKGE